MIIGFKKNPKIQRTACLTNCVVYTLTFVIYTLLILLYLNQSQQKYINYILIYKKAEGKSQKQKQVPLQMATQTTEKFKNNYNK